MRALEIICLTAIILVMVACTGRVDTADGLRTYVLNERNGLKKAKSVGEVEIAATIRPTDLLVAQELGDTPTDKPLVDSLRGKYGSQLYMILSMSAKGKEIESYQANGVAYSDRVSTLSFRMNEYVTLVTDQRDTIPMLDYTYQRTFGVGGASEMLLVFDKSKIQDAESLSLNVRDIGLGIGRTKLKFDKKAIDNIPKITF